MAYRIHCTIYKVKSTHSRKQCPYRGTFSSRTQAERALAKTKRKLIASAVKRAEKHGKSMVCKAKKHKHHAKKHRR